MPPIQGSEKPDTAGRTTMIQMGEGRTKETHDANGGIRVLCVDDEPGFAETTAMMLERTEPSFEVTAESDPEAARELLTSESFDCIVSDYDMPGMDGIEFLNAVREGYPELPFVLFTGKGSEEVASEAISAGVTEYIQKGYGEEQYAVLANRISTVVERFRTQRELEHMRRRYDMVAEASADAFFDWDLRADTAVVDEGFRAEFGPVPDGAYGWWVDRLHPEDRNDAVGTLQETFATGDREWHDEYRFQLADGSTAHVESLGYVVYEDDEPVRMVGVFRDVTDRKERLVELQTFREAVENAGHSVYWTDSDARIQYVNEAFEKTTGYSSAEAVGRTPKLLKSGNHDDEFYAELWETITAGDVWKSEIVNERADGERYTANQTIAPIETEDGEIEHFVAINTDITERKERERKLRRLRGKYEGLIEGSPDALFVAKADTGEITEVNTAAETLLGRSREDLLGSRQTHLHPDGEAERYRSLFERHLRDARDGSVSLRQLDDGSPIVVERSDGERIPVEINASTVDLDDEELIIGAFRDVTERREREARLREQNRQLASQNERLDGLVSTISHDLRNPLNIASAGAELVAEECESDHLDAVSSALERMGEMIEDMLTFAETGQPVTDIEPVDVATLAESCWRHVPTTRAELRVEATTTVEADRSRLKNLFENLLLNAVEHGGDGVTVRVGDLEDGFFVEDDGPGIPTEEHQRVFDSGFTTSREGTGFGLAIVRQIANAHEWNVVVTDGPEGGARFELRSTGRPDQGGA